MEQQRSQANAMRPESERAELVSSAAFIRRLRQKTAAAAAPPLVAKAEPSEPCPFCAQGESKSRVLSLWSRRRHLRGACSTCDFMGHYSQ